MPEGHVIHRLADELTLAFGGRPVRVTSPQGRFADAAAFLDGTTVRAAEAFGKHLLLDFSPPQEALAEEPGEERARRHEGPEERAKPPQPVPEEASALRDVVVRTLTTTPQDPERGRRHEGPPSDPSPGPFVHIHLGLIGKLRWVRPGPVENAATLRLRIETDEHAAELRGPQTCALIGPDEVPALLAGLGPDPLRPDADPERAWQRVHRSGRSIASLLMDQRVAAGVGNIYRAEVLFRQRIHPDTPGNALSRQAWRRIWADLVELMPQGVRHGRIDTVRPEHTPEAMGREARVDRHGGEVYVYRRAGQPCLVCGREVGVREFEARNLYWCARCQRRR